METRPVSLKIASFNLARNRTREMWSEIGDTFFSLAMKVTNSQILSFSSPILNAFPATADSLSPSKSFFSARTCAWVAIETETMDNSKS